MGRRPCCEKEGMNRGAWTAMEDKILTEYISINGEGKWRNLPISAGLKRCGKSCRLRWLNYLRPDIKRGNITRDEEDLIIRLHKLLGNRWSLIAGRLPGRTDNEIKNYWNTTVGKKITHQLHARNRKEPISTVSSHSNNNHHQNPQPPSLTRAIRTKATRCTKVIFSKDLQNIQQKKNGEIEKKSFETTFSNNDSMEMLLMGPQEVLNQGSVWALDESKSFDLKIDTTMNADDHIISNILEVREFLPYSDFQHHQQHDEQNGQAWITSPLMMANRFFEEDVHAEFDVDWITSLLHTELNPEASDKIF